MALSQNMREPFKPGILWASGLTLSAPSRSSAASGTWLKANKTRTRKSGPGDQHPEANASTCKTKKMRTRKSQQRATTDLPGIDPKCNEMVWPQILPHTPPRGRYFVGGWLDRCSYSNRTKVTWIIRKDLRTAGKSNARPTFLVLLSQQEQQVKHGTNKHASSLIESLLGRVVCSKETLKSTHVVCFCK